MLLSLDSLIIPRYAYIWNKGQSKYNESNILLLSSFNSGFNYFSIENSNDIPFSKTHTWLLFDVSLRENKL